MLKTQGAEVAGAGYTHRAPMSDRPTMTNVEKDYNYQQYGHRMFPMENGYELQVWTLTLSPATECFYSFKHPRA